MIVKDLVKINVVIEKLPLLIMRRTVINLTIAFALESRIS